MRQLIICSLLASFLAGCTSTREEIPGSVSAPNNAEVVIVKRGDFLQRIADQHGVGWEALLLANEPTLKNKYEDACGDLSPAFRNRRRDRGTRRGGLYYCNDRYRRPYGNTLRPGWQLAIPATTAPASINAAVADIQGDAVAIVIDDTGSMSDDRQKVGAFYLAALRQYNKRLVGVWLYTDGRVRKYEAGGVRFLTQGNFENTFGALAEAAREKPDAIVLVTDEPGDDWRWSEVHDLPPVVAHCLEDQGEHLCKENLKRLAAETHGRYVPGIK